MKRSVLLAAVGKAVAAMDVALDEIKRDEGGKFSSGGGSGGSSKQAANTSPQAQRLQSIIKNGPRTKSEHAIMASHYTKQASAAKRAGDLTKAANMEKKLKAINRKPQRASGDLTHLVTILNT